MKRCALVATALALVAVCVSAHASEISLHLDVGYGQWQAYATATNCDGISSFIIDVTPVSGDVAVTSSQSMAPWGIDASVPGLFGFANFANGANGIGISAGQPSMYPGGVNNLAKDSLVLLDVGILPGSHLGASWGAPVLLAQGTYSGDGQLKLDVGDGFFNTLNEPWTGPGHVSIASVVTSDIAVTPEPATLTLLGAGAALLKLMWRTRRRVRVNREA